jgi:hypothetical protein
MFRLYLNRYIAQVPDQFKCGFCGESDVLYQPDRVIRDIPRRQTQASRPPLKDLFQRRGNEGHLIALAYRQYGYRLREIAEHLGVHEVTVSRRLR